MPDFLFCQSITLDSFTLWLLFIYSLMFSDSLSLIKLLSSLKLGCDDIWHVWAGVWWICTLFSVYSNLTQHWLWFTISELPVRLIAAQKHHIIMCFTPDATFMSFFFHFKQQQKTLHAVALMKNRQFYKTSHSIRNTPLYEWGSLFKWKPWFLVLSALLFMLNVYTCTVPAWCHWKNMDTLLCV